MNYVYFVNGKERKPTAEEVEHMTAAAMDAAGYVLEDIYDDNIDERSIEKKKSEKNARKVQR